MKTNLQAQTDSLTYNKAVKEAYFQILKQTKAMLATLEQEPYRYSLIREDKQPFGVGTIVHELINPLIYMRLECHKENKLAINFGVDSQLGYLDYNPFTAEFVRTLYKLTMSTNTGVNIEDCIRTDFIITEAAELYEFIEEGGNKNHRFELIKHRPKAIKRKLRRVA